MRRTWITRLVVIGLWISAPLMLWAQADPYELAIQRVLRTIYTGDDQGANVALQQLQDLRPGFPAPLVYRELLDSWRAGDDPLNETLIQAFERDADKAIAECLKWTRNHPADAEGWRYLASAYGQRARFTERIEFKHARAASFGLKTRKAVDTAYALDPDNADILVGVGGAHYFAAHLPATLRFFAWLLGIHGDRSAGLRELTRAKREGKHSHVEGAMVLAGAYWTENDYNKFQETAARVTSEYPRLLSVRAWQVEAWICADELHDSRMDDAIEQAPAGDGWKSLQHGRIALARGQRQEAAQFLSQAISAGDANFSVKALACKGLDQADRSLGQSDRSECRGVSVPSELYVRTFPVPKKCHH